MQSRDTLWRPPGGGLAFFAALSGVLAGLKLAGIVTLPWWAVALPFLAAVTLAAALLVGILFMATHQA